MRADLTEKLFRAYDADTNGYLDLDEFIMLVQVPPPQTPTLLDRPDKPHTKQLPDGMSLTCRFPGGRNTTLQWILRESRRALRWLAAQEATLTPICLHYHLHFTSIITSVYLHLLHLPPFTYFCLLLPPGKLKFPHFSAWVEMLFGDTTDDEFMIGACRYYVITQ